MEITMQKDPAAVQPQSAEWQDIVESLGKEFSCPISEVEQMLSAAVDELEQGARIKEFIAVLAVKQVKNHLRMSRRPPPNTNRTS